MFVIGGRHATCEDVLKTTVRLDETLVASPVIGAVIGLCAEPADQRIGRMDAAVADELGVDGMTILAVRPDRFVGFRHDGGDLAQLAVTLTRSRAERAMPFDKPPAAGVPPLRASSVHGADTLSIEQARRVALGAQGLRGPG